MPSAPPFLIGRALWVTSRCAAVHAVREKQLGQRADDSYMRSSVLVARLCTVKGCGGIPCLDRVLCPCRLAPAIPAQHRAAYMQAAVAGLAAGSPPPVQIGACRALAQLCEKARQVELGAVAQQMFAGLCQLLRSSSGGQLPGVRCRRAPAHRSSPLCLIAGSCHHRLPLVKVPRHLGQGPTGQVNVHALFRTGSSGLTAVCPPPAPRRGAAPGAGDPHSGGQGGARGSSALGAAHLGCAGCDCAEAEDCVCGGGEGRRRVLQCELARHSGRPHAETAVSRGRPQPCLLRFPTFFNAEPALHAWINNVADPLLSVDARELLEALAAVPACLPSLQACDQGQRWAAGCLPVVSATHRPAYVNWIPCRKARAPRRL